jgi:hypothetical protein
MKSRIFIITAIISVVLISGNIFSQEFRRGDRERDGMRMKDRIEERLNLSDEQADKIEYFRLDHRKEMIDLRADVEKKEVELEKLKNTLNYSREEYLKKVNDIISAKNKIDISRANHQMDIYQLLDDNQKKEWNKMTHNQHERKQRIDKRYRERLIN